MVRRDDIPRRRRQRGASLLEALVALTLMAVAILWTMILLVEAPRIERRLEAHREVARLLEIQLETIRSRSGPLLPRDETEIDPSGLPSILAAEDLRMSAEVETEAGRSLRRLTLTVRYTAGGRPSERQIETLVFAP